MKAADIRCAVVTGASSGIGAETAVALAVRKIPVAIAARRGNLLAETARRCREAGGDALPLTGDMTRRSDVEGLRDAALARFGGVSAWVNNVGRGISRAVGQMTEAELDSMLNVNLKSAFYGIQAILPHFRQKQSGVIVNVSSILGRVPYVLRGGYCAAKHALLGLTGCLRQELAAAGEDGIAVCSVLPGPVTTQFSTVLEGNSGGAAALSAIRSRFEQDPEYGSWLGAQSAAEVAEIVVQAILDPRPEIYTSAALRKHALAYFRDPQAREEHMRPIARMTLESVGSLERR